MSIDTYNKFRNVFMQKHATSNIDNCLLFSWIRCWCIAWRIKLYYEFRQHSIKNIIVFLARTCEPNTLYDECVPRCALTCKNMHRTLHPAGCSGECNPGCQCVAGYVLHEDSCILADECPCHYIGQLSQSYQLSILSLHRKGLSVISTIYPVII